MILLNDAVWIFAKGLADLNIIDELEPPNLVCAMTETWRFGKRIYEFIKAVSFIS